MSVASVGYALRAPDGRVVLDVNQRPWNTAAMAEMASAGTVPHVPVGCYVIPVLLGERIGDRTPEDERSDAIAMLNEEAHVILNNGGSARIAVLLQTMASRLRLAQHVGKGAVTTTVQKESP